MTKYRVRLVERVNYWVDVEAEDEAGAAAEEAWCASPNPDRDFEVEGEGVYFTTVTEVGE